MQLTITLNVEQLMAMPGDAIIKIIDRAKPDRDFLNACYNWETRDLEGKGRWPVTNHIRMTLAKLHPET